MKKIHKRVISVGGVYCDGTVGWYEDKWGGMKTTRNWIKTTCKSCLKHKP